MHLYDIHIKFEYGYPYLRFKRIRIRIIRMFRHPDPSLTVASLLQTMDEVGSLDSSRDLQPIRAKKIVNRFYLILQISKISFPKFLAKWSRHRWSKAGIIQTPRWMRKALAVWHLEVWRRFILSFWLFAGVATCKAELPSLKLNTRTADGQHKATEINLELPA